MPLWQSPSSVYSKALQSSHGWTRRCFSMRSKSIAANNLYLWYFSLLRVGYTFTMALLGSVAHVGTCGTCGRGYQSPTFLRGGAAFYPNDAGKGLPVSSPSFSPLVELHFREEVQWVPLPEWHVHPIQQALRRPAGLLGWRGRAALWWALSLPRGNAYIGMNCCISLVCAGG